MRFVIALLFSLLAASAYAETSLEQLNIESQSYMNAQRHFIDSINRMLRDYQEQEARLKWILDNWVPKNETQTQTAPHNQ